MYDLKCSHILVLDSFFGWLSYLIVKIWLLNSLSIIKQNCHTLPLLAIIPNSLYIRKRLIQSLGQEDHLLVNLEGLNCYTDHMGWGWHGLLLRIDNQKDELRKLINLTTSVLSKVSDKYRTYEETSKGSWRKNPQK